MEVYKIGSLDFTLKVINYCKYDVKLSYLKQEHCYLGSLSRIECYNEYLSLNLHALYLNYLLRPILSYQYQIKEICRVSISEGTISKWFYQNMLYKGVLISNKYTFSDLKYADENAEY